MKPAILDLFNYTPPAPQPYNGEPPAQAHSPTSVAAAEQIKRSIGPLHQRILGYLKTYPDGATDEEMQLNLEMAANTQRPRRRELELMGRVVNTGRTRRVRSGREAVIWEAT